MTDRQTAHWVLNTENEKKMPTNETYMVIQCMIWGTQWCENERNLLGNFWENHDFLKFQCWNLRTGMEMGYYKLQNVKIRNTHTMITSWAQCCKQHKLLRKWLLSEINVISISQIWYFEISHPMIGLKAWGQVHSHVCRLGIQRAYQFWSRMLGAWWYHRYIKTWYFDIFK